MSKSIILNSEGGGTAEEVSAVLAVVAQVLCSGTAQLQLGGSAYKGKMYMMRIKLLLFLIKWIQIKKYWEILNSIS